MAALFLTHTTATDLCGGGNALARGRCGAAPREACPEVWIGNGVSGEGSDALVARCVR